MLLQTAGFLGFHVLPLAEMHINGYFLLVLKGNRFWASMFVRNAEMHILNGDRFHWTHFVVSRGPQTNPRGPEALVLCAGHWLWIRQGVAGIAGAQRGGWFFLGPEIGVDLWPGRNMFSFLAV